jgi:hypothetical protein
MLRRRLRVGALVLAAAFAVGAGGSRVAATLDTLPARLSDAEFWQLSQRMSEPDGTFRSDNLLSNELRYPEIIPDLIARVKPGGVYLGVGPEQNFNYIVATRPKMVFITDIRRGNLHVQLMYKALFELSADRSEFVARLFSKPRRNLPVSVPVGELMTAYWALESSPKGDFDRNFQDIKNLLTAGAHRIPLSQADLTGIEGVYYQFYWFGPLITYNSSSNGGFGGGSGNNVNYDDLMRALDEKGAPRSYLATDETFQFLKDLQRRNMVVPVVGDFGGPKALRAVGQYIRERDATVSVFYLSNVEQYLRQNYAWDSFCANVASMPLTTDSTFIRSSTGGGGGFGRGFTNVLGMMQPETAGCVKPAPTVAPPPAVAPALR